MINKKVVRFPMIFSSEFNTVNIYFVPQGHTARTWVMPQGHNPNLNRFAP